YYKKALAEMPSLRGEHEGIAEVYRRTQHPDWAAVEEQREKELPEPDCASQPLACHFLAGEYEHVVKLAAGQSSAEAHYWMARAYTQLSDQAFNQLERMPPSAAIHDLRA